MTKFKKAPGGKIIAPNNFVELARKMCRRHVAKEVGVHEQTVERWEKEAGIKCIPYAQTDENKERIKLIRSTRVYTMNIPDDFEAIAPTLTIQEALYRWDTSQTSLYRWCNHLNIKLLKRYGNPAPDDYSEIAPTLTRKATALHYKVHPNVIERWSKETGIKCKKFDQRLNCLNSLQSKVATERRKATRLRKMHERRALMPAKAPKAKSYRESNKTYVNVNGNDMRTYGADTVAADALRNNRWVVSRCDNWGKFKHDGSFYRVGAKPLMTKQDMINMALRSCRKLDDPEYDWLRGGLSSTEWLAALYQAA